MKELLKNKTFIITAVTLLVLMIANPSEQKHKDKVNALILEKVSHNEALMTNPAAELIGVVIQGLTNNMVYRNDYVLFSLTEIHYMGTTKIVGVGVLGMVFISKEFTNQLPIN